jgi:hypothetical protein
VSDSIKLDKEGLDLDSALRQWPEAEKPASDWEAMAQSIVDRARGSAAGGDHELSDDALLAAPLGRADDEGDRAPLGCEAQSAAQVGASVAAGVPAAPSERQRDRDRQSLKELARMASDLAATPSSVKAPLSAPSPSARLTDRASWSPTGESDKVMKDDSGIVDLAAAAQADPEAAVRAQSTPLATHDLFAAEDEAPPAAVRPAQDRDRASERRPLRLATAEKTQRSDRSITRIVGGVLALGAAAAALLLLMKAPGGAPAPATVAASVAATSTTPAPPVTPPPALAADPNALPAASSDERLALAPKAAKTGPGKPAPEPIAKAERAPRVGAAPMDVAPSPAPAADLASALRKESGDDGSEKTPAAALTGAGSASVPQKPSQGAVTGALGAVLPEARACLGPDDPVSRATIVFLSSGAVQSVSVSGPATGRPSEGCIKDALSKAKVQPFAEPSYTASITVRHN